MHLISFWRVLLGIAEELQAISAVHSGLNFREERSRFISLEDNSNLLEKKLWEFPAVWVWKHFARLGQFSRKSFVL